MNTITTTQIILSDNEAKIIKEFFTMLSEDIELDLNNSDYIEIMDIITGMYNNDYNKDEFITKYDELIEIIIRK